VPQSFGRGVWHVEPGRLRHAMHQVERVEQGWAWPWRDESRCGIFSGFRSSAHPRGGHPVNRQRLGQAASDREALRSPAVRYLRASIAIRKSMPVCGAERGAALVVLRAASARSGSADGPAGGADTYGNGAGRLAGLGGGAGVFFFTAGGLVTPHGPDNRGGACSARAGPKH
jgi:hypothetical protein